MKRAKERSKFPKVAFYKSPKCYLFWCLPSDIRWHLIVLYLSDDQTLTPNTPPTQTFLAMRHCLTSDKVYSQWTQNKLFILTKDEEKLCTKWCKQNTVLMSFSTHPEDIFGEQVKMSENHHVFIFILLTVDQADFRKHFILTDVTQVHYGAAISFLPSEWSKYHHTNV